MLKDNLRKILMSDWITVVNKNNNKDLIEKNCSKFNNRNKSLDKRSIVNHTHSSVLDNNEIDNIFEDEYGNYIEESINKIFHIEKDSSYLLNNLTSTDVEYFFYSFINKEESIPAKYKKTKSDDIEQEIYSDEEY